MDFRRSMISRRARSRKRPDPAVARMDRQRLGGGEAVQEPIEHQLVLDVPPQRPDHRWSEKEDAGGNLAHADAGQCLTERFQAVRAVGHAGQNRVEPRFDGNAVRRSIRPLARAARPVSPRQVQTRRRLPGSSVISPIRPWTSGAWAASRLRCRSGIRPLVTKATPISDSKRNLNTS